MSELILDHCDEHYRSVAYLEPVNKYWRVSVRGGYEYLHRIILGATSEQIVDHKNRIRGDNRRSNLRVVSASLNCYNRDVKNILGRGIYFDNYGSRFRACISHKNKTLKLGSFKTIEDAKAAYNKKALEIYGDDAFQHDLPHYQIEVKK